MSTKQRDRKKGRKKNRHACSWRKLRDGTWGIVGPHNRVVPGKTVTVERQNGRTDEVKVGRVLWENSTRTIARVAYTRHIPQSREWTYCGLPTRRLRKEERVSQEKARDLLLRARMKDGPPFPKESVCPSCLDAWFKDPCRKF